MAGIDNPAFSSSLSHTQGQPWQGWLRCVNITVWWCLVIALWGSFVLMVIAFWANISVHLHDIPSLCSILFKFPTKSQRPLCHGPVNSSTRFVLFSRKVQPKCQQYASGLSPARIVPSSFLSSVSLGQIESEKHCNSPHFKIGSTL